MCIRNPFVSCSGITCARLAGIARHSGHRDLPVWQEAQDGQVVHCRSLSLPDGGSAQLSARRWLPIVSFVHISSTTPPPAVIVMVDASNKWTRERLHPSIVQALCNNAHIPSVLALNKVVHT